MKPVIATFYTPAYAQSAQDLRTSVERLSYEFFSFALSEKGNWLANCGLRAEAMLTMRTAVGSDRGVLFLDADTMMLAPLPDEHFDREMSVLYEKGLISTSLIYVKGEKAWKLVEEWARRIEKWPRILDRQHFHAAWAACQDKPDTRFLDTSKYLVPVTDREDAKNVVIEHKRGKLNPADSISTVTQAPTFESMKGELAHSHMICAGVGPSARMLIGLSHLYWTFGVNDIGRYFHPDFLMVVDSKRSFEEQGRWPYIEATQSGLVFYNEMFPLPINRVSLPIKITNPVGERLDISGGRMLPCYRTSVHSAVVMAYFLGATKIGIIGADFLPGHPSSEAIVKIDDYFKNMASDLSDKGVELVNLSPISRVTSLRLARLDEFETKQDWSRRLVNQLATMTPSEQDLAESGDA